jgi:hypothetical protein
MSATVRYFPNPGIVEIQTDPDYWIEVNEEDIEDLIQQLVTIHASLSRALDVPTTSGTHQP